MNHAELKESITRNRKPGHCIVKWWGEDEALVDYELLDRFLANIDSLDGLKGVELIDMEGIWKVLKELDPDPLSREQSGEGEIIRWTWKDQSGKEHVTSFPFTPEGVMDLMESEFFD
ncbi:hypothetical protein OR1_00979 [Geobacter sp. OR-1]|uniref:hypothetical protein n=1 Tax=Geobacter sp. OR-1 TaxID=1266765 RepID=UPI000543A7F3|nr:hypothetical protein [Geobacter sp. OR-1]GAM08706.1 hypothetical protein OR1_00979 [Geobacter sp. OR-1]